MIGIIGFGRFGKLVSHYLARDLEVFVYNRSDKSSEITRTGAQAASLETVCRQDIVPSTEDGRPSSPSQNCSSKSSNRPLGLDE